MKKSDLKKFWKRLFNKVEVGDRIRINGKNAPTPVWCSDGKIGKIIGKHKDRYGIYFEIHFSKRDNPRMTEENDIGTFREEYLELI